MKELLVGDPVVLRGVAFVVGGFSPVSVVPRVVYLNDSETGRQLDVVLLDEVLAERHDPAA